VREKKKKRRPEGLFEHLRKWWGACGGDPVEEKMRGAFCLESHADRGRVLGCMLWEGTAGIQGKRGAGFIRLTSSGGKKEGWRG